MTSRRDPKARIEKLEAAAGIHGPLGQSEAAELRQLEADREARFPGEVKDWDDQTVDDFLDYQRGPEAARLDHLRHRAMSPAELRATEIAIGAMSLDELDEWMLEQTLAAQEQAP